ncbi:MAG: ribonuclease HII [Alphaproteobacteria bacterium]
MPDYRLEGRLGGMVCGIDEAGRGPWAGPVVAGAVVVLDIERLPTRLRRCLDDSKKLTARRREDLLADMEAASADGHLCFAVAAASAREIDRVNILRATWLAMSRALARLPVAPAHALIDGNRVPPGLPCPAHPVVGGDGLSLSIAAASIAAKVARDRLMTRLDAIVSGYGFARNAGYGTAEHRAALAHLGVSRHHRRSFAPIRLLLETQQITA